jgi:hypothetical protein
VKDDLVACFQTHVLQRGDAMLKAFAAAFIICVSTVLMSGCSSIPWNSETAVLINPSKFHEDCIQLKPGDSLIYSFRTSDPVDFNIHYHENGKIYYPVSRKKIADEKGKYTSGKKQFYCLMWTNRQKEPVSLTYSYDVREK